MIPKLDSTHFIVSEFSQISVTDCSQNGAGPSGSLAGVAIVPAGEEDKFHAASVFNIELPTDPSFVPNGVEHGAVFDDEDRRLYDKLEQGPPLDDPIVLREPQETELEVVMRIIVLQRCGDTSLSERYKPNPPVHGPFGEGNISLVDRHYPIESSILSDRQRAHGGTQASGGRYCEQ